MKYTHQKYLSMEQTQNGTKYKITNLNISGRTYSRKQEQNEDKQELMVRLVRK